MCVTHANASTGTALGAAVNGPGGNLAVRMPFQGCCAALQLGCRQMQASVQRRLTRQLRTMVSTSAVLRACLLYVDGGARLLWCTPLA